MNPIGVRRCVRVGIGFGILLLLIRTFVVMGLVFPVRVASSSMAPALVGPHRMPICFRCHALHRVDATSPVGTIRCIRCGASPIDVRRFPVVAGDRVLVNRVGPRRWRRWELVVFHCPERAHRLCVKRVVGLPGETVSLRGGDVFVDGQLVRKPLPVQQRVARPVRPPPGSASGDVASLWKSKRPRSGWLRREGGLQWRRTPRHAPDDIDWMTCEPQLGVTRVMGPGGTHARRAVAARDVMVTFTLVTDGPGQLRLATHDGPDRTEAQVSCPRGPAQLLRNGRPVASGRLPRTVDTRQPSVWTWSLFDARWVLAVNGHIVLTFDLQWQPSDRGRPAPRLAIGTGNLPARLSRLSLWRDVDYVPPVGSHSPDGRSWQLGQHELMVLGDNSPLSRDSRHWPHGPGLPVRLIVGRVIGRP